MQPRSILAVADDLVQYGKEWPPVPRQHESRYVRSVASNNRRCSRMAYRSVIPAM